jgi:hypothetical protein
MLEHQILHPQPATMYACNQNPASSKPLLDYDSSKNFDRCQQPTRLDQALFKVQQDLEIETLHESSLPFTAANYDAIFEAVSKVLKNDPSSMDPTPIGLHGVSVVDRVPLIKSAWIYDHTMRECLRSFVPNKRKSIGVSSLMVEWNYNPVSKRQKIEMDDDLSLVDWKDEGVSKRQNIEKEDDSSSSTNDSSFGAGNSSAGLRIRAHQSEQWLERYRELCLFQEIHGHCLISSHGEKYYTLALWVKRQRYQYRLRKEGQHSSMTDEREAALQRLGFVWDSQGAIWEERVNELRAFKEVHGQCNVPANFSENRQLAIWVKCQRRQYRLFCDAEHSNMTKDRFEKLSELGFVWNPRRMKACGVGVNNEALLLLSSTCTPPTSAIR